MTYPNIFKSPILTPISTRDFASSEKDPKKGGREGQASDDRFALVVLRRNINSLA